MREGVLVYDHESGRMDIRFDLLDYYGGLHCGEPLEVKIGDEWIPTTIELGDFWYLKGVYIAKLNGLHVRIKDTYDCLDIRCR